MENRRESIDVLARRRFALVGALLLVAAAMLPGTARQAAAANPFTPGAPYVYRTDAVGEEPPFDDFTNVLPLGSHTERLFITAGEDPGTGGIPCRPQPIGGDGEQLCAFDVRLQIPRPGHFTSFTPAAGLDVRSNPPAGTLSGMPIQIRLNFLKPSAPLAAGAFPMGTHELGTVGFDFTGDFAVLSVTGMNSVRAITRSTGMGTGSDPVESNVIAAPEPSELLLLPSALLGLAALYRLRMGRRG
jgi:hypothetical protein